MCQARTLRGMAGGINQSDTAFKSVWSQMLPPSKAWLRARGMLPVLDELPGDEVLDVHPLWELVARGLKRQL